MSPALPGHGPGYADQFQDRSVVEAYRHRAPYPPETFEILETLCGKTRTVLDLGCGTGDLARHMSFADRVDAVDLSPVMIAEAKRRGEPAFVRWFVSPAESAPLEGPYGLITAAESIHWMDWASLFPRLRRVCDRLAIVVRVDEDHPWRKAERELIVRYSSNREFRPYDLIFQLENAGYFRQHKDVKTSPVAFRQTVDDYIECLHSRNGFSRERMDRAAEFDDRIRDLVRPRARDGVLALRVGARIVSGTI